MYSHRSFQLDSDLRRISIGILRSKVNFSINPSDHLVGVFLPSIKGTSLDFLREILSESKLHLKSHKVINLEVPAYTEISVKNMYEDAMKDEVFLKYLPSRR